MLENGSIVEKGTYEQLKAKQGNVFNEFIRTYFEKKDSLREELTSIGRDQYVSIEKTVGDAVLKRGISRQTSRLSSKNEKLLDEDEEKIKDTEKENLLPEKHKEASSKIVEKEKIESGSVKFSITLAYLRASRLYISIIFIILYILSYVSDMGKNYWLSNWSNKVADNKEDANKIKFYYLGVYAAFGISSCKYLQIII